MKSILFSKNRRGKNIMIKLAIALTLLLSLGGVFNQTDPVLAQQQAQTSSPNPDGATQPKSAFDVNQMSDFKTYWWLTELGGGINYVIIFDFALGLFLIVLKIYDLIADKYKSRLLLSSDYRQHTISEISGMVKKFSDSSISRLYSVLLTIFYSTGSTADFHDEVANYIQMQQERFNTFKTRMAFFSDTAGALGLLGTVWGIFVTFFGGNLDNQRILNGMGIALVTTLFGLVASIVLNFFTTEVFSVFNKRMENLSAKADEFRLWLMAINHQRSKKSIDGQPSGEGGMRSATGQEELRRKPAKAAAAAVL